jgi:hypothetical protein
VAISVGSVSVDVVPDARKFVPDLRSKLSNLPKVSVQVEAATAQAEAALGRTGPQPDGDAERQRRHRRRCRSGVPVES